MIKQFPNYIGGEWTAAAASWSPNRNPSDLNDVIGEYAQAAEAAHGLRALRDRDDAIVLAPAVARHLEDLEGPDEVELLDVVEQQDAGGEGGHGFLLQATWRKRAR